MRRKSFGRGLPLSETWLTVETDLRADFRHEFPNLPLPVLRGLALKADSNDTPNGESLAWLRGVSLHTTSLRAQGFEEGDAYQGTVLRFR